MQAPTWDELEQVVNEERCSLFLSQYPRRYQKALALALVMARWSPTRKVGVRGDGGNGLCAYDSLQGHNTHCPYCPLRAAGEGCYRPGSLYDNWAAFKRQTTCNVEARTAAADAMYAFLCKLYEEEYNRCKKEHDECQEK
jgi:hypothetical protein